MAFQLYCPSLTEYSRFTTREVRIGDLFLGGSNPIRVQSMTTTDTMNTLATVEQSIRMIDAGCELVRITAPSKKEAENLANIKQELRLRGYLTPLVADIHFTPNAAEIAARIVEKVRVNPGNYADKKKFEILSYTDSSYQQELDRIREKFTPLVKICKEYGTALRIGTNHGSLSDRILSRYGDTPLGMVESAMEFLRMCEDESFHNIVISMKSSNPQVMIQAYRLLVATMVQHSMNYPLHLGVTEAGDGEDGRIKSSVGIGTLLEDGLGDTIRVSLTEDPECEIPVAKALVKPYNDRTTTQSPIRPITVYPINPFEYSKRITNEVSNIGGKNVPRIIADFSDVPIASPAAFYCIGYSYSYPLDKWNISDLAADMVYIGNQELSFETPGTLGVLQNHNHWNSDKKHHFPYFGTLEEFLSCPTPSLDLNIVHCDAEELTHEYCSILNENKSVVVVLSSKNTHTMSALRRACCELVENNVSSPIIFQYKAQHTSLEDIRLASATTLGGLLIEGFGDGIWLTADYNQRQQKTLNDTAFGILQATRTRISKTEYISCPSCGRTLFDLQETTAKIRSVTSHLKGVKIGIMGCIVNGPGEMADADYGYVGSGPDKITLYKGRDVVNKNVPTESAVDQLIELIKQSGDWVDPV